MARKVATAAAEDAPDFYIPKLYDSKLKELTWSLDIKQAENPVTDSGGKKNV